MFGTIISDAYKKEERGLIASALDELCSPRDNYGWASSGIYSFWDYTSREVYYIGLAVDLTERFKQHNGLIPMREEGCKISQINQYFDNRHEKLGYSIFVQSPLSQGMTSKNQKIWKKIKPSIMGVHDLMSDRAREDIKQVEGILIETYLRKNGDLPSWNKVGGSISGQKAATVGNYDIVEALGTQGNLLASKYSLRELAENPTYERYENFMHGIRIVMLSKGITFGDALKWILRFDHWGIHRETFREMQELDYFNKVLEL